MDRGGALLARGALGRSRRVVTVRVPGLLADQAGGQKEFEVEAPTVRGALEALPVRDLLFDERGELRPLVNVYVGREDIRTGDGIETALSGDETIRVVHSIGNRAQLRARLSGQASPVEAVAISQRLADQRTIAALRRAASATFVWGVGDVARALDLVRSGADGLIVDGADILAEIRSRLTSHPEGAAPAPASVSVTRRPTALSHSAR